MKINILYNFTNQPFGGGNQFLTALKNQLIALRLYENNPLKADAIIFNSLPFGFMLKALNMLYMAKRRAIKLIHRVDGPISGYRGKDEYVDKAIYQLNNKFADATVFQSEWSRQQNYLLGLEKKAFETTIFNAPNAAIFNKDGKIEFSTNRKTRLIAVSWSSNRNKGFDVYEWLDNNLDFAKYEMTFVGNSPIQFKNIIHIQPLQSNNLAIELKKHDIYITASQKDPCSNSLIEALSCGLPAVVLNDGGHTEIVQKGGEIFNTKEEIPAILSNMVKSYTKYTHNLPIYHIDKIAQQYVDFAQSVVENSHIQTTTSYFSILKFLLDYKLKQL